MSEPQPKMRLRQMPSAPLSRQQSGRGNCQEVDE